MLGAGQLLPELGLCFLQGGMSGHALVPPIRVRADGVTGGLILQAVLEDDGLGVQGVDLVDR